MPFRILQKLIKSNATVNVVGNRIGDPSSNLEWDCLHFVGYHPPFSTQWTSPSAIYSSSY